MDIDKIIGAMRVKRNSKIIEAQDFSRGGYSKREMLALADGYSMAVKDLSDLITQQTPPSTGSSINKISESRIKVSVGDYVETIDNEIGYVYKISYNRDNRCISVRLLNGNTIHYNQLLDEEYDYTKYFNKIGQYNFYDECKTKTEKLKLRQSPFSCEKVPPTNEQLIDKINEIIDVINGER